MTDPRMTPTNDAPVTVEGYAEAEAMLSGIIRADLISDTAIRIARDHMMQFARHRLAALASAPAGDGDDEAASAYVAEYVMSTEGADYEPTDWERELIEDALHGFLSERSLARPRAAVGEQSREAIARIVCEIVVRITCADNATEASIQRQTDASWQHWTCTADRILALQSPPAKVEGL